ncbi:MBL fold metallo-hydrolase [bacterium]|nr:MBL fold metallo-hydrolase [bacterium]
MNIKKLIVGQIETNCYLVYDDNKNCIVIDPGGEAEKINSELINLELKPSLIVLTHAHCDHIMAAPFLRTHYSAKIYVHESDAQALSDPQLNLSALFDEQMTFKADVLIKDKDAVSAGELDFEVLHTPGHSPGGISLYSKGVLFAGDAIFKRGIGRTDLPGGDYDELMRSIQKLFKLPVNTVVYPGHGPQTTIGEEKFNFR